MNYMLDKVQLNNSKYLQI